MAKPQPQVSAGSPDRRFRSQIEAAVAGGAAPGDMVLRLTQRDAAMLMRDRAIPVSDINFAGGVMRFLGVKVEQGGIAESALLRP